MQRILDFDFLKTRLLNFQKTYSWYCAVIQLYTPQGSMFSVTLGESNNLSGPHFPYLLVEQIML